MLRKRPCPPRLSNRAAVHLSPNGLYDPSCIRINKNTGGKDIEALKGRLKLPTRGLKRSRNLSTEHLYPSAGDIRSLFEPSDVP